MAPAVRFGRALAGVPASPPLRFVFGFFPNGCHHLDWAPEGEGRRVELSPLLEPLARHRHRITFFRGLSHRNARALGDGPGDHARSAACYLTGAHPRKTGGSDIQCGPSIDQEIARRIGRETLFPSLQLGIEGARKSGQCDSGYACVYSSHISWADAHTPLTPETHPRGLFDRLFLRGPADETARARAERISARKSILDAALEDARRLQRGLGVRDRRKVDAYLTGVRELERRIEEAERVAELARQGEGIDIPDRRPVDYDEHVKLQGELMVLALRLDLTRVISFMIAGEGSNRTFPQLGVREGHHSLSHHRGDPGKIDAIRRINRYQSELFAHLLDRLSETEDSEGSLLDHSLFLWGGAIRDGNRHDHHDLPVLLAGEGGGTVPGGRIVRAADHTPLCNLYLSILHLAEAGRDREPSRPGRELRFGDSTGPLPITG